MNENNITANDFMDITRDAASATASAWSEAAVSFSEWLTAEQSTRVVTETEQFERFAVEINQGFRNAAESALDWGLAARNSGHEGAAKVYERYAAQHFAQADGLLNSQLTAKMRLDLLAADASIAMQKAGDVLGGGFGRAIGPAFDAYQMMEGALDWASTGSSDTFGAACTGVVISAGFGAAGAGVAAFFGAPVIAVVVGAAVGAVIGSALADTIYSEFHDAIPWWLDRLFGPADVVNISTTSALNWVPPRRAPLVLDLDGGGITTSGINPAAPILFDQDGDGTMTATGWIAAGEAIVVRDLNGNGTIDSGRELFGDNTILTRGPNAGQLAANGFAALADLDANASGVADGKFDANDVAFSSVKLWKDLNQDGVSQSGELFTFAQLGIQSINVSGTATNIDLGGGNTQTLSGSFTRVGGATGASGTAELAGSLLLANNNFYREFTDDPAFTVEARALPQMSGSGTVRDLRPAMSLATTQALDLQAKVAQFAADTTRDQQLAHLDALIQSWGATSAMLTSIQTSTILANPAAGAGSTTTVAQSAANNPGLYAEIMALERFNGNTKVALH